MNPENIKIKEENLFSLATEMGLVVISSELSEDKENLPSNETYSNQKPFFQLT
jgi:hypothetical protein